MGFDRLLHLFKEAWVRKQSTSECLLLRIQNIVRAPVAKVSSPPIATDAAGATNAQVELVAVI